MTDETPGGKVALTYLFQGIVHPQRAHVTMQCAYEFTYGDDTSVSTIGISILLNQIAVWIGTTTVWDVYDLRNVVKTFVSHELEVAGLLKGHAYEVEIVRVLNPVLNEDYVFGVEIGCIAERGKQVDFTERVSTIRNLSSGSHGRLLRRAIADFSSAMKHADDTGFYCYRAVESLRQHCAAQFGLDAKEKKEQWTKFRDVSKCTEANLMTLKSEADPVRHGGISALSAEQRGELLKLTWDVTNRYVEEISVSTGDPPA